MADDDNDMGDVFDAPVFKFVPKGGKQPVNPGAFPSSEMHFDPAGSHADDPEADTTIHFDPSRVNPYESAKLTKIPLKSSRPKPPFTLKLNTTTAILLGVGLFLAWQMMTGGFPFGRSNPFDGDDED